MIQLSEGICYSPFPPSRYKFKLTNPGEYCGLAKNYEHDLQMWNLMWLAEPAWDLCLTARTIVEFAGATRALDAQRVGLCDRALTMADDIEDFGSPALRELLMLPPRTFMHAFCRKNINCLELTAHFGSELIQTMWARARLAQPNISDTKSARPTDSRINNVVPFRRTNMAKA